MLKIDDLFIGCRVCLNSWNPYGSEHGRKYVLGRRGQITGCSPKYFNTKIWVLWDGNSTTSLTMIKYLELDASYRPREHPIPVSEQRSASYSVVM